MQVGRQPTSSAVVYGCDVSDADAVEGAVEAVIDEWGRIDVLVNNAGIANVAGSTSARSTRRFVSFDG